MFFVGSELWPLWIVLIFIAIGVVVFLLRKFVPGLSTPNEPIDEKKQAEEDVNRVIMSDPVKEEKKEEDEEEDEQ